jgi:hypothetical protein
MVRGLVVIQGLTATVGGTPPTSTTTITRPAKLRAAGEYLLLRGIVGGREGGLGARDVKHRDSVSWFTTAEAGNSRLERGEIQSILGCRDHGSALSVSVLRKAADRSVPLSSHSGWTMSSAHPVRSAGPRVDDAVNRQRRRRGRTQNRMKASTH